MAAAVTLSGDWLHSIGDLRLVTGTVAFDNSYPTGGESLTAAAFGLGVIDFLIATGSGGYVFFWDGANSKLKVYFADYDGTADGALIEFTSTGDLAALTAVPVLAIGR